MYLLNIDVQGRPPTYFKRDPVMGRTTRISKHEYDEVIEGKKPGPKYWTIATYNTDTKKTYKVVLKRGKNNNVYSPSASSFFGDTADDEDAIDEIVKVVVDNHLSMTLPPVGERLHYDVSSKSLVKTLGPKKRTPARPWYIPTSTASTQLDCYTAKQLTEARAAQESSSPPMRDDTYNACVGGKCKYVLTAFNNSDLDKYNTRLKIEKAMAGLMPTLVKSWQCKQPEEFSYYLHEMTGKPLGTGSDFTDKVQLKKQLSALVNAIHTRMVTVGGQDHLKKENLVYTGDPASSYALYITDISQAKLHTSVVSNHVTLAETGDTFTKCVVEDDVALKKIFTDLSL